MNNHSIGINEHDLPMIIRDNVRIDWVNLNEGNDGDYDPTDKYDTNLLRFDVYRFDGKDWEAIEDGSYCTQVAAGTDHQKLVELLNHFMDTIYDDVSKHGKAKRLCEQLSWTE
jgi:hypothetical protein